MTDKTKHTPLPLRRHGISATNVENEKGRHVCSTGGYSNNMEPNTLDENVANAAHIIKVWNAYYPNQATIDNLISAFEPLLELAKRKADYPADLGMVTRADEALTRAKGQS